MIDRKVFFDAVRGKLFNGSLSAEQVAGMNDLLDVWERSGFTDRRWLAYIFGGVYHEVGRRMVPVREGFAKTDAGARAAVAKLFKAGRISRNYALPNAAGVSFYGRGRIQNTHEENYRKLQKRFGHPFLTNPDLLLDSKIDAEVTVYGHVEGIWTGKKLADYINSKTDFRNARRIINGTDKAAMIAGYASDFLAALEKAYRPGSAVEPAKPIPPAPEPVRGQPDDPGPGGPADQDVAAESRRWPWLVFFVFAAALVAKLVGVW